MGPGDRGLHGATAAGHVAVVCHLPVVTATAPGQSLGPSPNSEATLNIHHPLPHLSPLSSAPSRPTIGGKYCLGERRRHRSCNTDVSSPWPLPPPHPITLPPTQYLLSSSLQTIFIIEVSSLKIIAIILLTPLLSTV